LTKIVVVMQSYVLSKILRVLFFCCKFKKRKTKEDDHNEVYLKYLQHGIKNLFRLHTSRKTQKPRQKGKSNGHKIQNINVKINPNIT
jgi:hypothetical protein